MTRVKEVFNRIETTAVVLTLPLYSYFYVRLDRLLSCLVLISVLLGRNILTTLFCSDLDEKRTFLSRSGGGSDT